VFWGERRYVNCYKEQNHKELGRRLKEIPYFKKKKKKKKKKKV